MRKMPKWRLAAHFAVFLAMSCSLSIFYAGRRGHFGRREPSLPGPVTRVVPCPLPAAEPRVRAAAPRLLARSEDEIRAGETPAPHSEAASALRPVGFDSPADAARDSKAQDKRTVILALRSETTDSDGARASAIPPSAPLAIPADTEAEVSSSPSDRPFRSSAPQNSRTDQWLQGRAPPLAGDSEVRPGVLRPPGTTPFEDEPAENVEPAGRLRLTMDPPLGYTGHTGILPSEPQTSSHFVPIEDRWRLGFPNWDRYGKGHPLVDDYPYVEGECINPYKQNVLKGDYPIIGQHTFLNITASLVDLFETRNVPTPTTPFESTERPGEFDFFGRPNQFFFNQDLRLSVDLFHGDAAFKPADWRIHFTPVFNVNYLAVQELGIVNPNVLKGTDRARDYFALQEWFVETKLADTSPNYDFISVRTGSQPFVSDFRGFIFADTNRAVRLFGTRLSNRDQFNIIYFDQLEKDTNSELNTFEDRGQHILIMNYYRQDFIWPGYTTQFSFHYNHDSASLHFDKNDFLVRPDPVGVFQPHTIDAYYLGWTGDGHINRFNITHAFYQALGHDTLNPLAGREININAQMAAAEVSYDRDWIRFRTSYFYASGDHKIDDGKGTGFDTILDNPNFAGGQFSYWQRQAIKLFGVNLVNRMSLVPDLRSSKTEGQVNFVNPGLQLINVGMDFDVTPKLRLVSNCNFLWFNTTSVLKQFVFQEDISHDIGTDLSLGFEYRPKLNNNVILTGGISGLIPGEGFRDLYAHTDGHLDTLIAAFLDVTLTY